MIGANIEISKICVRDLSKPRDFTCSSDIGTNFGGLLYFFIAVSFCGFIPQKIRVT